MVERQIVALDVVGSSPTILPLLLLWSGVPDRGLLRHAAGNLRWGVAKW